MFDAFFAGVVFGVFGALAGGAFLYLMIVRRML
jgi:hypothetical protein